MKLRTVYFRTAMSAAWILTSSITLAQNDQLSLKHGAYVREPYRCGGQPNAAILSWDGVGFSGAHSTRCTTRVLSRQDNRYQLSTACAALGDGSSNPSGHPDVGTFSLTRLSNARFVVVKEPATQGTYRWCSAEAMANPK
jgi:hypothetical protein